MGLCLDFEQMSTEWVLATFSDILFPFNQVSSFLRSSLIASFSGVKSLDL